MFDPRKPDNFTNDDPAIDPEADNSNPFARLDPDDAGDDLPGAGRQGGEHTGRNGHPAIARWLWILLGAAVVAAIVAVWIRYFNPVVSDAVETGYVTAVERRGVFFKTYEGNMVPRTALADSLRIYNGADFSFSLDDDSLATRLQALQGTGRAVTLRYKRYNAAVPWRGASKIVVTAVEE